MFGYVVPNQAALSDEAQKRYRTAYCGLCRRIDALHGLRGRFTLSYDLTFLNLLLCSLYEGETEASSGHDRCPIHPLGGVEWRAASPTDYCADLSVALHYYNAEDKWKDDRSLLGLGYEKLLTGCKQAAESRWPRQCSAIRTCLDRLAEYEAAGRITGRRSCAASASIWASSSTCWMPMTIWSMTSARGPTIR